jgi:hypothetical protein
MSVFSISQPKTVNKRSDLKKLLEPAIEGLSDTSLFSILTDLDRIRKEVGEFSIANVELQTILSSLGFSVDSLKDKSFISAFEQVILDEHYAKKRASYESDDEGLSDQLQSSAISVSAQSVPATLNNNGKLYFCIYFSF